MQQSGELGPKSWHGRDTQTPTCATDLRGLRVVLLLACLLLCFQLFVEVAEKALEKTHTHTHTHTQEEEEGGRNTRELSLAAQGLLKKGGVGWGRLCPRWYVAPRRQFGKENKDLLHFVLTPRVLNVSISVTIVCFAALVCRFCFVPLACRSSQLWLWCSRQRRFAQNRFFVVGFSLRSQGFHKKGDCVLVGTSPLGGNLVKKKKCFMFFDYFFCRPRVQHSTHNFASQPSSNGQQAAMGLCPDLTCSKTLVVAPELLLGRE